MFPAETRPYIDESVSYDGYPQNAEKVNGRWAMIGFVSLLGAYVTTGQIIPGIICPVVRYAPTAAIRPIIANLPLSVSATTFSFSIVFVLVFVLVLSLIHI